MSWHFSQALEAAFSAANCSGGNASVPSKSKNIPAASLPPGKMTDASTHSPSGMMCEPLTARRGVEWWISSLAASRAKTSALPEKAKGSTVSKAVCGRKWRELSAKYCPRSSSWKTHLCLWEEDLPESSVILPRWGMMLDGVLWERTPPVLHTKGKGSGSLPTPSGTSNHGQNHVCGRLDEWGGSSNPWRGTETGRIACASFEEWVMGWPVMWTGLMPYETARFQQWSASHGISSDKP